YRYDKKGGSVLDSVDSDQTIASDNEQIIPEWGVSVQIYQEKYFFPDGTGNLAAKSTDMIESSIEFKDSSKRWLGGVPDNDAYFPTNWIRSGDYAPVDDENDAAYECQPNGAAYLDPCKYRDEVGADPDQKYESVLEGTIAPHRLVGYQADYMPLAYFGTFNGSSKTNASISFLPSVNIVLTDDESKWTRCPVIELGRNTALNIGQAASGAMRKSPSVDKNGNPDGTGTGMGWFPGYAVDLESGARLYMAFGENSFLGGENGADMVWNPTDRLVSNVGTPLMGGVHAIYVFSYKQKSTNGFSNGFDFPAYIPSDAESNGSNFLQNKWAEVETNSTSAKRELYGSLAWVAYPMLEPNQTLLSTDVTIKLRINKEYKNFVGSGENGGRPMYSWSMDEIATELGATNALQEALDMINVVPNPYYAFSEYERTRLDTRVKITNLPEKCTVSIYTTSGKLVRTFKKDSEVTSLDWDLTNHKAIPVAGDVYLIYVEVPGVGTKVLKFFGGMRQVDLQGI
ncbi:MAG: T9SS C-terminal target domain-containing protein, partial [Bacteroidetes bacterium]|nr:T9SS C-terminal target domain-containing protein [Bacteroidota bacterium]